MNDALINKHAALLLVNLSRTELLKLGPQTASFIAALNDLTEGFWQNGAQVVYVRQPETPSLLKKIWTSLTKTPACPAEPFPLDERIGRASRLFFDTGTGADDLAHFLYAQSVSSVFIVGLWLDQGLVDLAKTLRQRRFDLSVIEEAVAAANGAKEKIFPQLRAGGIRLLKLPNLSATGQNAGGG